MVYELHFTSAPSGLKPGMHGFCTVAATLGIPEPLQAQLEQCSTYHPIFPPGDPNYALNPVTWSHRRLSAGGRRYHALSRIAVRPPDYTGRTNFYAHHFAFSEEEVPPEGPVRFLLKPGVMMTEWRGDPRHLPPPRLQSGGDVVPVASAWRQLTRCEGWPEALANLLMREASWPVLFAYAPGQELLLLLDEIWRLMPTEYRWRVEFTTLATESEAPAACCGFLAGTTLAREFSARRQGTLFDLSRPLSSPPRMPARVAVESPMETVSPTLSLPPRPQASKTHMASADVEPMYTRSSPSRSKPVRQERFGLDWVAIVFAATSLILLFFGITLHYKTAELESRIIHLENEFQRAKSPAILSKEKEAIEKIPELKVNEEASSPPESPPLESVSDAGQ